MIEGADFWVFTRHGRIVFLLVSIEQCILSDNKPKTRDLLFQAEKRSVLAFPFTEGLQADYFLQGVNPLEGIL